MDISRQRSFPNSTTAFAYDTTIMQLLTGENSLERLRVRVRVSSVVGISVLMSFDPLVRSN